MQMFKSFFSFFVKKTKDDDLKIQDDTELLKKSVHQAVFDVFQKTNEFSLNTKTFSQVTHNNTVSSISKDRPVQEEIPHDFDHKILTKLNEYNQVFFDVFCIPKSEYKIKIDKKNIIVEVNNKIFENELSKSDKLSIAYERIFYRLIQTEFKDFDYRVLLCTAHSVKKHQEYITNFAKKMATKVQQTGKKVVIPSKSNYERSLIHHIVETMDGVQSKSIGTNSQRNLMIYPKKNAAH